MKRLARVLCHPLVCFALIGALLFALDRCLGSESALEPERIDVTSELRAALVQRFEDRTGAPPSPDEERALIDGYVRDEIMVREALVLGLGRGDPVIRRRLIQRLEFLAEDLARVEVADDATLAAYLTDNDARYRQPERSTVDHVFVRRSGHDADDTARAEALLRALGAGADPARLGDPFAHGAQLVHKSHAQIEALMGPDFARGLDRVPVGSWHGPLASSYGLHLVRVRERQPERLPGLSEIREQVYRDWSNDARARAARQWLDDVRARYRVVIEPGARP